MLAGYGTGAIMAVPAQDERDWAFAEVFELPIVRTVQPADGFDGKAYTGDGPAINSAAPERGLDLDGLGVAEAKAAIIAWLEANGHGAGAVTYRLRDWLFSRQRYWGEPFPIVYDETGAAIALPESMLPVELPEVDDFSPKTFDADDADSNPETPLSRRRDWVEVELDLGDGPKRYTRETNVMPQWAGSCWYELRYLDPTNTDRFVDAGERAVLDGAARRGRLRRHRPVRRRRRARRAAPAVRPVLAQGAVRPGARVVVRAVPQAVQPGHDPGVRVHRLARQLRAGRGGRRARRRAGSTASRRSPASTARWASR